MRTRKRILGRTSLGIAKMINCAYLYSSKLGKGDTAVRGLMMRLEVLQGVAKCSKALPDQIRCYQQTFVVESLIPQSCL